MRIRCIAVDDEPLAVKELAAYIEKVPFLELVAECRNAAEAMVVLDSCDVQLLFIDINMPDISGIEFVKSLTTQQPHIVFTTAYSEYALEGFRVDALDYLLKPISFSDFLRAANKAKNIVQLSAKGQKENLITPANHLFVKSEHKLVRIYFEDVKYIESQHEYIRIHLLNGQSIMTKLSLKSMEEQLSPRRFMRVHRSFIVNLEKITLIERNRIVFDGKISIPVSEQYKDKFQAYIDQSFL